MEHNQLLKDIQAVETAATASKLSRLLQNPYRYLRAMFHRYCTYAWNHKELLVNATIFLGKKMHIALPAATDIYLTGGKSHSSKIRLSKYLVRTLAPGDCFLDIGAHYGYYTLLAETLVGSTGRVISLEPASVAFDLLRRNTEQSARVTALQLAIASTNELRTITEFPNLYSEFNTLSTKQIEHEKWYDGLQVKQLQIPGITIDSIVEQYAFKPTYIKMDTERGDYEAIMGGLEYIEGHHPTFIVEYFTPKRDNAIHQQATQILRKLGYQSFVLLPDGSPEQLDDLDTYLLESCLVSDNFIFSK